MRVVPQDGGPEIDGAGPPEPTFDDHEPTSAHPEIDAMRSWLVNGVHLVDRRRRFGSHGRARELLVVDRPGTENASERWQALAAALHRHTVRGGLSELGSDERRVITLAYLEGRTNREIAAMLGVSVATVRRRLWIALGLLEAYIARTGVWLSAFILVAATSALRAATRGGRWVTAAVGSTDRAQRLVSTLTAGALSAGVLGIVALTSDSSVPHKSPPAVRAPSIAQTNATAPSVASIPSHLPPPSSVERIVVAEANTARATDVDTRDASAAQAGHRNSGCDGNPTSAPPAVPVASGTSRPSGAPVTHPDAGGCRS
jgi:Sigma-70, region 4